METMKSWTGCKTACIVCSAEMAFIELPMLGSTLVILVHEIMHPTGLGYIIYHRFITVCQKWNIHEKKLQRSLREILQSTWKITKFPYMPGPSRRSSFVQWGFPKHWGTICLMSLAWPNPLRIISRHFQGFFTESEMVINSLNWTIIH